MMIFLEHPLHGTKIAYTDQEAALDIKNGWTKRPSAPEPEAATSTVIPAVEDRLDREELSRLYAEKHGRKPHPKMSLDKLAKAV